MADLLYTQDYPIDTTCYDYAYLRVRHHTDGSSPLFVPWRKLVYQVIDEGNGESLFERLSVGSIWSVEAGKRHSAPLGDASIHLSEADRAKEVSDLDLMDLALKIAVSASS